MNDKISFGYRSRFIKVKECRYLSHLDITRIIFRAMLRAGFDLDYSQGFNPKPRLSFSNPTPLGVDSIAEYCDMFLERKIDPDKALDSLNSQLDKNLQATELKGFQRKEKSLMASIDLIYYEAVISRKDNKMPNHGQVSKIMRLKDDQEFKESIFGMETIACEAGNNVLLKLLGYAKILKATKNKVFKFNYFFDCFKDMAEDEELSVKKICKKECFILKDGKLFTPIEVL